MPSALAFRYARALADIATGPSAPPDAQDPHAIKAQLSDFVDLLQENRELQVLFSTPAVSTTKKKAVLAELAQNLGLAPLTRNFLQVVIQHERMNWLSDISEAFGLLLDERLGIVVAEITTARPLEEEERHELAAALVGRTNKQVRMQFSLDPTLIGGAVARIGSTIYDGSIRGQLERLRATLVSE